MTSPMKNAAAHDQFVLLDGSKRWPVPGISAVTVTMSANTDTQNTPAAGTAVVQLNEATCEIEVKVWMWNHDQWAAYQSLLAYLRKGTQTGPAVFTSAHPEVRARKVKRLYFDSEQNSAYTPKDGYRVTLKFKEKLKAQTNTQQIDPNSLDGPLGVTAAGATTTRTGGSSTDKEQSLVNAALQTALGPPVPSRDGRTSTATPGNCSVFARVAGTAAGMDPKLFGASAKATEANFLRSGMAAPWNYNSQKNLRAGQLVFFGGDKSGYGHVGVVTSFDSDGTPLVTGNSYSSYLANGGKLDAQGNAINPGIDSRGTVRLDRLGSTPTSVGYPGGVPTAPAYLGPAAPLPANRPSLKPPKPPM